MSATSDLLAQIADPDRGPIAAAHVAIVTAHPDDETLAFGTVMARLEGVKIIVATDGAPRDLNTAKRLGFATAADYAAARRAELARGLALAGKGPDDILHLDFPDQEAAANLGPMADALSAVFDKHGVRVVLTHAYEGGHPDHDAVAAAVALATRGGPVEVIESPFYREADGNFAVQTFVPLEEIDEVITTLLTPEEAALKLEMLARHETQAGVFVGFTPRHEQFRPAPAYDFGQPPNGGAILYLWADWAAKVGAAFARG